jgi:chromosome segregation ATPase
MNLSCCSGAFGITQSDSAQHLPAAEAVGTISGIDEVRSLQNEIVRLESKLQSKQGEIRKLCNDLAKVNLPASSLRNTIRFQSASLERYKLDTDQLKEDNRLLKLDNARLTSRAHRAQDDVMHLTRALSLAKEDHDALNRDNNRLRSMSSSTATSSQSDETSKLRLAWAVEKAELQSSIMQLHSSLDNMNIENKRLQDIINMAPVPQEGNSSGLLPQVSQEPIRRTDELARISKIRTLFTCINRSSGNQHIDNPRPGSVYL